MTALMQAVKANQLDTVAQLLAGGANVNQADGGGDWPVIMAAYLGHTAVLELLLQAGADLGVLDSGMKATALHAAAYAGRTEAARLLIPAVSPSTNRAPTTATPPCTMPSGKTISALPR